jgi:hypothetical protein
MAGLDYCGTDGDAEANCGDEGPALSWASLLSKSRKCEPLFFGEVEIIRYIYYATCFSILCPHITVFT